jgi:mannosyltransferase
MRADRLAILAVAALTAAAALLRFATLDVQSFWSDEAVTAALVSHGFTDVVSMLPDTERTPPLYYVLAWTWTQVFGAGEVGLRSLSALAGTATVPVAYLAGRELVSRPVGIAAAAIVTTHPLLVWYSQEARAYPVLVLLIALALLFFVRTVRSGSGQAAALWSVASVLALATHYVAIFVVASMAGWLLVRRRSAVATLAVGAVVIGGAALLPLALAQAHNTQWFDEAELRSRLTYAVKQVLVGSDAPYDRLAAVAVAGAYLIAAARVIRSGDREARSGAMVVGGVAGVAFAVPLALASVTNDYFVGKNTLAVVVPFALAAAVGLGLGNRTALLALTGVCLVNVALAVAVTVETGYHRGDWRGAAEAAARGSDRRLVVVAPDWGGWFGRIPFRVYLPEARSVDRDLVDPLPQFQRLLGWETAPAYEAVVTTEILQVTVGVPGSYPGLLRLPPGFRMTGQVMSRKYAVVRYRSRQPVEVVLARLVRRGPDQPDAAVLLLDRR